MPGLVGLITAAPREAALRQVEAMVQQLRHEAFYVSGIWSCPALGIYVGWTALEGSFASEMPLQCGRESTLFFSGEDFSVGLVGTDAAGSPDRGSAKKPAYLLDIYRQDGASFPSSLNGRFHGLVVSEETREAVLFNDRYGMHRLYFYEGKDGFYFAAEAKAILAVRPELRRISRQGLAEFIACGCVLENRSLFEGIEVLPPASAWRFRGGMLERKSAYFNPQDLENQEPLSGAEFYEEFRGVFTQNLPRYFLGRQPVGMSLTGGLDTRMIMAWQRQAPGSLPCYTFGGSLRECRDVVIAREVANICGQPHQVLRAGSEFLTRFHHYAERAVYLTDSCADVSRAPDLFLNERARQIAPVRMTGNYGSEILRSVRALKPEDAAPGLFCPDILGGIDVAKQTYAALLAGHPVSFAAFKQGPWYHYGILGLEQTQVVMRSPFLDNDLVKTVFRAPRTSLKTDSVSLNLIADGSNILRGIPTDRGIGGLGPLAFVGNYWFEFLFKLEYAFDMGMPQWLARLNRVSPIRLEDRILGRHKVFHFRLWYREVLHRYLQDILLDSRSLSRGYAMPKAIERIVRLHVSGAANYTNELHKLLTLELAHRLFIDTTTTALRTPDHGMALLRA